METAVKSAFQRINKEFADSPGRPATGMAGGPTAPVRPNGPSTSDPAPFGAPRQPGGYPQGPAQGWPAPRGSWGGGNWGGGNQGGGWGGGGFGGGGQGGGGGWGGNPWGTGGTSPLTTGGRPFSAARAYDKLVILTIIALVSALVGYLVVPIGVAFACMIAAFGLVLVSWFRMRWARVLAPAYAVLEGVALGAISGQYATIGHGIVPLAVVFTAGVFVSALTLYRTGLVRVTPRMVSLAIMGGVGLIAVSILALLGLSLPGVNSFGTFGLLFGIFALAVGVLNLFADFEYVNQSERMGVSADAEWAAAFALMTALVLVYISILRILAALYGGGGRRQ